MRIAFLVTLSMLIGKSSCAAEAPNILIYLADDQYLSSVGCYGADPSHTPNIDRLARQGARFDSVLHAILDLYAESRGSALGNVPASQRSSSESFGFPRRHQVVAKLHERGRLSRLASSAKTAFRNPAISTTGNFASTSLNSPCLERRKKNTRDIGKRTSMRSRVFYPAVTNGRFAFFTPRRCRMVPS